MGYGKGEVALVWAQRIRSEERIVVELEVEIDGSGSEGSLGGGGKKGV